MHEAVQDVMVAAARSQTLAIADGDTAAAAAAAAALGNDFADVSDDIIAEALQLRGFLHPRLPSLCQQLIEHPLAKSFRGERSPEASKVAIVELMLIAETEEDDDTSATRSARAGTGMGSNSRSASFFCMATSWTPCAPSWLAELNIGSAFHPALGVPLAALPLYVNSVRRSLSIEDGSLAYWTLVEVVCKADEERVKILFKEQDAAQYCRQAK
eukprot:12188-Heterococcus_DN1.PRE.1